MLETEADLPALWLPGFYDVKQLINTHIQKRARKEGVPTRLLSNVFSVMDTTVPSFENCPAEENTSYFYGMHL